MAGWLETSFPERMDTEWKVWVGGPEGSETVVVRGWWDERDGLSCGGEPVAQIGGRMF